jgi:hypothetical protein
VCSRDLGLKYQGFIYFKFKFLPSLLGILTLKKCVCTNVSLLFIGEMVGVGALGMGPVYSAWGRDCQLPLFLGKLFWNPRWR